MLLRTTAAKALYVAGVTLFLTSLGCWVVLAHQDRSSFSSPAYAVMKDQAFLSEAALDGRAEIELGQLALHKGTNETVKNFGARMVDEHTKAEEKLTKTATKEHILVPADLPVQNQGIYSQLSKLSGAQFDRAYAEEMVKSHKRDLRSFQREAEHGKDDSVKSFASNAMPTIQENLRDAREMLKQVSPTIGRAARGHARRLAR